MKKLISFVLASLFFLHISYSQDAVYKVEFISNWNSSTHPTDYPSGSAHWSPLIGATHKDAALAFELGVVATNGVEQVAETGATTIIRQEINNLITAGLADQIVSGTGLGSGPGTITITNVNVAPDFPYISLITMIAPSPDWVAMIGNQKLTDTNGDWVTTISVDVYATDAGTDSGATYTSANADVTPHQNMSSLQNVAPFSDEIIGTFVFTLEQVLSTQQEVLNNTISIYPNPVKDKINIANSGAFIIEKAELYTVSGKRIQQNSLVANQKTISVHNGILGGVYFLRLHTNDGVLNKKLIILD